MKLNLRHPLRALGDWVRDRRVDTLTAVTVVVYSIAVLGALASVFTSAEWSGQVSHGFLLTAVVVPFVGIAVAFALQAMTQRYDTMREIFRVSEQSRFMRLFEDAISPQLTDVRGRILGDSRHDVLMRLMYQKLAAEMEAKLKKLHDRAVVEAFEDYWSFCAEYYTVAREYAECTSLVPIEDYDLPDMKKYVAMQTSELIDREIPVSRTFLFREHPVGEADAAFRNLCLAQANAGFRLYYLILTEVSPRLLREQEEELWQDFALIDGDILQLGTYSVRNAQQVLYYEFHLLRGSARADYAENIGRLFVPPGSSTSYWLKIQTHRLRLSKYVWRDLKAEETRVFQNQFRDIEGKNPGKVIDRDSQP